MATLLLSEHEELEETELPRGEGGGGTDEEEDDDEGDQEEAWRQPLTEVREQLAELRATTETKFSESQAKLDQVQETAAAVLAKVNEPQPSIPQESPSEATPHPQEPAQNSDSPKPNEASNEEIEPAPNATAEPPKTKHVKVLRRRRSI
jgi:hypothetical protein